MTRVVDLLAIVLVLGAAAAFSFGVHALAQQKDLVALYWLVSGALALKAVTELMRGNRGSP